MKLKRCFLIAVSALLLLSLIACDAGRTETPTETAEIPTEEKTAENESETVSGKEGEDPLDNVIALGLDTDFLKLLDPRMELTPNGITCDWSCAGVEFNAKCKGDLTFCVRVQSENGCRFRAYVDGNAWLNGDSLYYETAFGNATVTLKNLPEGDHTVKLVKVTGYTLARTLINGIALDGEISKTAPAQKEMFIEYIGDSIFCGWGVNKTASGKYNGTVESQDGTLAIPYLLSEHFDADYSVVAVSGQGVVFGLPNIENAYKYRSYVRGKTVEYTSPRKADILLLNVGTNDYSNQQSEKYFTEALERMLLSARAQHGDDCVILAVYGMMNDTFATQINAVFEKLGGTEKNYYTLAMDACSKKLCSHPSIEENAAYEAVIYNYLSSIMEVKTGKSGQISVVPSDGQTAPVPTIGWTEGK